MLCVCVSEEIWVTSQRTTTWAHCCRLTFTTTTPTKWRRDMRRSLFYFTFLCMWAKKDKGATCMLEPRCVTHTITCAPCYSQKVFSLWRTLLKVIITNFDHAFLIVLVAQIFDHKARWHMIIAVVILTVVNHIVLLLLAPTKVYWIQCCTLSLAQWQQWHEEEHTHKELSLVWLMQQRWPMCSISSKDGRGVTLWMSHSRVVSVGFMLFPSCSWESFAHSFNHRSSFFVIGIDHIGLFPSCEVGVFPCQNTQCYPEHTITACFIGRSISSSPQSFLDHSLIFPFLRIYLLSPVFAMMTNSVHHHQPIIQK